VRRRYVNSDAGPNVPVRQLDHRWRGAASDVAEPTAGSASTVMTIPPGAHATPAERPCRGAPPPPNARVGSLGYIVVLVMPPSTTSS
jgi:hypothetical protein